MNLTSSVCIILPVRNEKSAICSCLDAILAQDYPQKLISIIVVDGLSNDGTREILARYENAHSFLRVMENPGRIVPTGMNIALREAKGDIVVRVDGHCIVASDYVRRCVEHIYNDGVDGVGGPMETVGETPLAQTIAIGMSSSFGVGNSAFRTLSGKSMLADTVPFPAYTRIVIERAGFYDEELVRNQDDEYNYRIRELGGKILLAADVQSIYFSRASLQGLWKQYYQCGFWKVRILQKHSRQMSLRQFVPPAFVLALLVSLTLVLLPVTRFFSLYVPGFYLLANLFASIYTAAKRGWKYLPLLPLIFAILHLSYGAGFLLGLVKFWNRWGDKKGKTPVWQS